MKKFLFLGLALAMIAASSCGGLVPSRENIPTAATEAPLPPGADPAAGAAKEVIPHQPCRIFCPKGSAS